MLTNECACYIHTVHDPCHMKQRFLRTVSRIDAKRLIKVFQVDLLREQKLCQRDTDAAVCWFVTHDLYTLFVAG